VNWRFGQRGEEEIGDAAVRVARISEVAVEVLVVAGALGRAGALVAAFCGDELPFHHTPENQPAL
jgi:hypothetical protein